MAIHGHTCISDDGGTPNRKCEGCEADKTRRCPVYHRDGYRCNLTDGHEGQHRHVFFTTVSTWSTDEHERRRLGLDR